MNKFLSENDLSFEAVWDVAVLGIKTKRVSKAFNVEKREMAAFTGDRPRESKGRPGEFEYDCSFCHVETGTAGVLR